MEEFVAAGRIDETMRAAASVWRLWYLNGDLVGGRALLATVLDARGGDRATRERGLVLYADGLLAFRSGDQEHSRRRNEQALAVARRVGDPEVEALALTGLSRVALRAGDYARVRALATAARMLVPAGSAGEVAPLHLLAAGTRLAGEYDAARELYIASLELNRRLSDPRMVGVELHNLGYVELHRGDNAAAMAFFHECSALRRGSHDPYDTAMEQLNAAARALVRNDQEGRSHLAAAEATLADARIELDPDDRAELEWLRSSLGATHRPRR